MSFFYTLLHIVKVCTVYGRETDMDKDIDDLIFGDYDPGPSGR